MGLSAVLIVKNEAKNIVACLQALAFADEIIVVDSGSSDNTVSLAKPLATKVVFRDFDNFASQKNYAVSLATEAWVLSVDADERVTAELREEIRRTILLPESSDAYKIRRKTNFFGKDFRFSGLQDDAPIRLFRRGKAIFKNPVHEVVVVDGKIGRLGTTLYHVSFQTIHEYWAKLQLYTTVESKNRQGSTKLSRREHFFARPFYRFFCIYVIKQGFRDGVEGFLYAVLSGYYEWVRWMKKWEILEGNIDANS